MATQRRFIEIGTEAEGLDDKTKKIIKEWQKDGWKHVSTASMGKNRRHMVFQKAVAEAEPLPEGKAVSKKRAK